MERCPGKLLLSVMVLALLAITLISGIALFSGAGELPPDSDVFYSVAGAISLAVLGLFLLLRRTAKSWKNSENKDKVNVVFAAVALVLSVIAMALLDKLFYLMIPCFAVVLVYLFGALRDMLESEPDGERGFEEHPEFKLPESYYQNRDCVLPLLV